MKRRLALLASAALLAGCLPYAAAATDHAFEAQQIPWSVAGSVVSDVNATGGQAVAFTKNTSGVGVVGDPITTVRVRARGVECWTGEKPNLRVSVGPTVLGNRSVSQGGWADYDFAANGATGQVKVEFTNEFTGYYWGGMCQRTLVVDTVTITTADPTPTTTTPTTTTAPTTTTTTVPPASTKYVAMGDSYSSGEGADRTPQSPTRDNSVYAGNQCGRSVHAAPNLIAVEGNLQLTFVACGGANTDNILTTGINGEPAQITRVTTDTDLVTMTIGGNDSALLWMLQYCIMSGDCWRNNGNWIVANYIAQFDTKVATVQGKVEQILRQVATRSPDAEVIVAGYPFIIAPPGEALGACSAWLKPQEQTFFDEMLRATNDAIKRAVLAVAAEGHDYRYADPLAGAFPSSLTGCSTSPDRYMNGADNQQGLWHPNIGGQARYADLYAGSL